MTTDQLYARWYFYHRLWLQAYGSQMGINREKPRTKQLYRIQLKARKLLVRRRGF